MPYLEEQTGPLPGGHDLATEDFRQERNLGVDTGVLLALARRLEQPVNGTNPTGTEYFHDWPTTPRVATFDGPTSPPVRGIIEVLPPLPAGGTGLVPVIPAHPALDPIPASLSRPTQREAADETESSWSGIGTVALLAGALASCILLIVASGRPPTSFSPTQRLEVPVIWAAATATAEGSAAPTATTDMPRLQAGPSSISRQDRDSLNLAQRLIDDGDVVTARTVLARAAGEGLPEARVLLAETYDPNVLAAWGMTRIDPDVLKARELYFSALALGQERARRRLEMLD
jgi:hypothetical protein